MPRDTSKQQQQRARPLPCPHSPPVRNSGPRITTSKHGSKDTGSQPSGCEKAWAVRNEPATSLLNAFEEKNFFLDRGLGGVLERW